MIGVKVKLFFKNQATVSGILKEWNENNIVLILDSYETFVVTDVTEVFAYSFREKSQEEVQNDFENAKQEQDSNERIKKLAELKKELISCEKEMISNKLKSHTQGMPKLMNYGTVGIK